MNKILKNSAIRSLLDLVDVNNICIILDSMSACYEPKTIEEGMNDNLVNEKEKYMVEELLNWKKAFEKESNLY